MGKRTAALYSRTYDRKTSFKNMRPSTGQNSQNIQGYPLQDAQEHPTNTNNVPSPNRPRSHTSVRLSSQPGT
eukprot:2310329-Pyramimonas_sp.AAC.1